MIFIVLFVISLFLLIYFTLNKLTVNPTVNPTAKPASNIKKITKPSSNIKKTTKPSSNIITIKPNINSTIKPNINSTIKPNINSTTKPNINSTTEKPFSNSEYTNNFLNKHRLPVFDEKQFLIGLAAAVGPDILTSTMMKDLLKNIGKQFNEVFIKKIYSFLIKTPYFLGVMLNFSYFTEILRQFFYINFFY